ncbi:hypothetical protein [Nocardia pseudovaccinii]|uniref:hypothetical protein n=1 Tax=Nocardia pseudovaccinii TaxID=189540 RepID=UPI0012F4DC3D|nr:hypothetical protein [Nocardia pseudovaccinii]
MTGHPAFDPEMHWKAWSGFLLSAVGAPATVTVPLISTLLTHTGWDRTSRYCRRLHPMWTDHGRTRNRPRKTARPPNRPRHPPAPHDHRHPRQPAPPQALQPQPDNLATTDADPHTYPRHIAEAITTKTAEHDPAHPRHQIQPGTRDLTTELHQLLTLTKAWPHVRSLTKSP